MPQGAGGGHAWTVEPVRTLGLGAEGLADGWVVQLAA